jgi:hypothetical protein
VGLQDLLPQLLVDEPELTAKQLSWKIFSSFLGLR